LRASRPRDAPATPSRSNGRRSRGRRARRGSRPSRAEGTRSVVRPLWGRLRYPRELAGAERLAGADARNPDGVDTELVPWLRPSTRTSRTASGGSRHVGSRGRPQRYVVPRRQRDCHIRALSEPERDNRWSRGKVCNVAARVAARRDVRRRLAVRTSPVAPARVTGAARRRSRRPRRVCLQPRKPFLVLLNPCGNSSMNSTQTLAAPTTNPRPRPRRLNAYTKSRDSRKNLLRRGEGIEPSKPGAARPCQF
jgi:hypothetical protein